MSRAASDVAEFHRAFNLPVRWEPTIPSNKEILLRRNLIDEEVEEIVEVCEFMRRTQDYDRERVLSHLAKELADLVYVTYGAAWTFGIDLEAVLAEVHRSNMTKLDSDGKPFYRPEDGKVLKGPFYEEADVQGVLFP